MGAGFRIWGDHGFVQIDSDYSNMGFVQGGTLNLTPGSVFGFISPMVTATLTVNGTAPVVALNGSGIFVNEYAKVRNGDQWTFYFRAASSTPIQVSYWVYDVANRALGASAPEGFRIFDAYGVMTCHGGMDPLKVVDFVNLGGPPDGWNGTSQENQYITSRTYDGSRTYAVIQSSLCRRQEDYTAANQFDYAVQPGNHMKERRILYSASRSAGSYFEFALATGESRIFETPLNNPETGYTNGSLAWLVIDVSGLGTAPPVNDVTPNAISWPNASFVTDDNYGQVNTEARTISGIAQTIRLKATVFPSADSFYDGNVRAYVNGQFAGSHRHSWNGSSIGSFEFDVTSGAQIYFQMDGSTISRRASGNAIVRVQNMSDGGVVLDEFGFSGVVDNDDNYNVLDLTPDAFSVPNLSVYTNAEAGTTNAHFQQITGINGTVTLRWTRDSLVKSANVFTQRLFVYKSTTGSGGPWTEYFLAAAAGLTLDIDFQNGDWFYTNALIDTSAGMGTAQWTNYIHNFNTGAHLATYTVTATVDADDNFYAADYTPNAVNWPDVSASDNGPQVAAANGYLSLLGYNQPIQVRHTVVSSSHNFSGGGIQFYKDGAYQGETGLANGSSMAISDIYAGSQLSWIGYGNTSSGVRSGSIQVHVTNDTTGEFIDAFWFHLTADADNNYNLADRIPATIAFSAISAFQPGSNPVIANSPAYTLTGFNVPTTVRAWYGLSYYDAQANISSDPFEPNMAPANGATTMFAVVNNQHVYPASHGLSGTYYNGGAEIYAYVEFTVNPGDSIYFATHLSIAGNGYGSPVSGSIAGTIYLDPIDANGNVDFANRIGQFGHNSTFSI